MLQCVAVCCSVLHYDGKKMKAKRDMNSVCPTYVFLGQNMRVNTYIYCAIGLVAVFFGESKKNRANMICVVCRAHK